MEVIASETTSLHLDGLRALSEKCARLRRVRLLMCLFWSARLLSPSTALSQSLSEESVETTIEKSTTQAEDLGAVPSDASGAVKDEPTLTPPVPVGELSIPYPEHAPAHPHPIEVKARLTLDPEGNVSEVEIISELMHPPFEDAVRRGVFAFRFSPARWGQEPISVQIEYTQVFDPPTLEVVQTEQGIPLNAMLRGVLKEKGTRELIAGAAVVIVQGETSLSTTSDEEGQFELAVPQGELEVRIISPPHFPYAQNEILLKGDDLTVGYLLQRRRYDPDTLVVLGKKKRLEVSRVSLKGKEIKQVPGTFGDPFRVIQTLPGVTTPISILPIPIIRGSSPSSTGFLLDRVRVPLLFHLLGGPSVIHPEFIEEIHFFPGGAPPEYGGYTGGIVDGETRSARRDERLLDLDMNLLQSGALFRTPIPGTDLRFTGAGRYGYPGFLIGLATDDFSLEYWDYQARLDYGTPRNGWTISSFGARDEIQTRPSPEEPLETSLRYEFHRIDAKHRLGRGEFTLKSQLALGRDDTSFGSEGGGIALWHLSPRMDASWRLSEAWTLLMGLDGSHRISEFTAGASASSGDSMNAGEEASTDEMSESSGFQISQPGDISQAGFYLSTRWTPINPLLISPGLRLDWQRDETDARLSLDPRLTLRYRLLHREVSSDFDGETTLAVRDQDQELKGNSDTFTVWLKAGIGRYHQPPRFLLPIPGLDQLALEYGLLSATQSTIGAELTLSRGFSFEVQTYYNDMDPVIFDLSINPASINAVPELMPGEAPDPDQLSEELEQRLFSPQKGRAYGVEMLLRRQSQSGVYGWLSYTLSRSERQREGDWVLFDFDRTHIMNMVVGIPLRNQWDIGLRAQYQSGVPATTTYGFNRGRNTPYVRFDLRIDKRAVWATWLLDYYIDIQNVLLTPEEVAPGQFFRYVLPTIGVRAKL